MMRWLLAAATALALPCAALAQTPSVGPLDWRNVGTAGATIPLLNSANAWSAPQTFTAAGLSAKEYWVNNYGTCTWGVAGGNDVGPCINAAIAAASAAGGGTVMVPAGTFNVATALVNNTSGVHLVGAGTGFARDTVSPSNALAVTRLVWTGSAGATMFIDTPGTSVSMYSADVIGILFDCANLANICAEFQQVSGSTLNFAVAEPRSIGAWFTTNTGTDAPGNQGNDIWVTSRSTSPSNTYSPTGILFDAASGSSWNTSFDRVHSATAWFAQGDGVVFGNVDNLLIDSVATAGNPGNNTGRAVVFASAGYVMPNGVATTGSAQDTSVRSITGSSQVLGYNSASTIVAGGGNTGTASVTTKSLTTNASTTYNNSSAVLNFASVSGVANGEATNCGGTLNGVASGNLVKSFTGATVTLTSENITTVPIGAVCVFSFGVQQTAVTGTYTITAASSSTFNITAPAGGTSQSGIAYSAGFVSFTDLVLPLTGTPVTGDTWTLTVPLPAKSITVVAVDENNSQPLTFYDTGTTGYVGTTTNPAYPKQFGPTLTINLGNGTASNLCVTLTLGGASCSQTYGVVIGGTGGAVFGYGSAIVGGQNGSIGSGIFDSAMVGGQNNAITGTFSGMVGGAQMSDRGRYGSQTWGSGDFATVGDAQAGLFVLRGTGSTGSAFRLTADGAAAGSVNCINIPNNTMYILNMDLVAFDHTTITKNAAWPAWTGVMTRGANAAATAVTMNSTPTPLTNGTLTGQAIAVTADTTNGCVNISYTPPTSNTDKFNVVARIATTEVQ